MRPEIATFGPAIPEPFLRFELETVLRRSGLIEPPAADLWAAMRRGVHRLGSIGGPQRVHNQIVVPLAHLLGYGNPERQEPVDTREGAEDGGWLMTGSGASLRAWSVGTEDMLDAPRGNGRAYRYSPMRAAQRVLRARRERIGLLTDGESLRFLMCDPVEANSYIAVPLAGWDTPEPPVSVLLLVGLASPAGQKHLPAVLDAARLGQIRITKALRSQARGAIEGFLQAVLDRNPDHGASAETLWAEGLVLVYRLLFILKLESASDPACTFSFAATPMWRSALSPNQALGPLVRAHLDHGHDTGRMLEDGLRAVFALFRKGLSCGGLSVGPLGGGLFGSGSTPVLDALTWSDRGVAILLDRLLWATPKGRPRERVHYGALDVENLGHVYEGLLELEPGIAMEPMVRKRRAKMDIVVRDCNGGEPVAIGSFYLRSGMGRKNSGSYYTPHALVRFLVRETLGPLIAAISPDDVPDPLGILRLRVVDPAMGSGHFLIEACRFLGEALYAACRRCDGRKLINIESVDPTLAAYMPSRAVGDFAEARALAICRRLVAVKCLYGVDRNPLAVELAKLAMWLESYAEGLPLTFLDHRLVVGDAIAGPFFADLATLPVGRQTLDPLLARGVTQRLQASVQDALTEVAALNASIGRDTSDLLAKDASKARLDTALAPLRLLARAWSGAVALGGRDCDDEWQALAAAVARDGRWPDVLSVRQHALFEAGATALPWDLTFPEVFRDGGFDAVLSNPPWDVIQYRTDDFVAGYDLSVLDAPTRRERTAIERRVLATHAEAFADYKAGYERQKRLANRLFGRRPSGAPDAFHLFAERYLDLGKTIGALLPSAFHANEGATYLRRRYFADTRIACCYSFENRGKLFDIDSRFKFDLIVARKPGPTTSLRCAFYLESVADLDTPGRIMDYDAAFLAASGGTNATPLELRGTADVEIARALFANPKTFGDLCGSLGIKFGCDLHMTTDAGRFIAGGSAKYTLHEGKTFHQYTDRWDTPPRYSVAEAALRDRPAVIEAARHRRLAFRDIARSTDERTMIAMIAPPDSVFGHTATVEKQPGSRPLSHAQMLCALMNSFVFDWLVRQKAATHLSLYLVAAIPVPARLDRRFLADATARLSGDPASHWDLRAEVDVTIAHAYGLNREQYRHVLASFSHRSFPEAPNLCLGAFDLHQGKTAQLLASAA